MRDFGVARPLPGWVCGERASAPPQDPAHSCRLRLVDMGQNAAHSHENHERIPKKGDRIESIQPRTKIGRRGTVFHVDQVQILVKWDDGGSGSLRPSVDRFRIIFDAA
jgi:uncharacterized protein DUF4314